MGAELIQDRGRGPEIAGTRITVYNLFTDFLDPTRTEAQVCRLYDLTPEQVAAARAFILNNLDTVLAEHVRIEERNAAGNPPEVLEKIRTAGAPVLNFKSWLEKRRVAEVAEPSTESEEDAVSRGNRLPTFREWLAARDARQGS